MFSLQRARCVSVPGLFLFIYVSDCFSFFSWLSIAWKFSWFGCVQTSSKASVNNLIIICCVNLCWLCGDGEDNDSKMCDQKLTRVWYTRRKKFVPKEKSENLERSKLMTLVKMLNIAVPETSYSSSEGEDDFYDANDDPFSSQVTTPTRWVLSTSIYFQLFPRHCKS